jgi:hypothetical protein
VVAEVVGRTGDKVTVEVKIELNGSMQEMDDAILEATKAAYRYVTEEERKRRDSDGSPIRAW